MARPRTLIFGGWLALGLSVGPVGGVFAGELLVYQGTNKWVAPEQNAPLTRVLNQARQGTAHFLVRCPTAGRTLCLARLDILQDLLSKAAGQGVVLQEVLGEQPVPSNRVWVQAGKT